MRLLSLSVLLSLMLLSGVCRADESGVRVVVFLGVECPLSKLYANRLNDWQVKYPAAQFIAVAANQHDTKDAIASFAKEHNLRVPFVKDVALAVRVGATRNPQAVILHQDDVCYSGRIDDQYSPGEPPRAAPSHNYLEDALREVLSGKPVSIPSTSLVGCFIDLPKAAPDANVTYPEIAGILHSKCASCHRPDQVAPFSLLTYHDAAAWGDTIREVVEQGRMPPWGADPRYGHFSNDPSLTPEEKRSLIAWIDGGMAEGSGSVPVPLFQDGWHIGPDAIFTMPNRFTIPAEGIVEYQEAIVDPHLTRDAWVQAVEIRPGNKQAVHHINAFLRPKDAPPGMRYTDAAQDFYLGVFIPGNSVTSFGPGIAKLIPAGWVIALEIHYVATGTIQHDQSQIGLKWADPDDVAYRAASRILQADFVLSPQSRTNVVGEMTLEADCTLAALYPHMHLRGKSMTFEAFYPDGKYEVLLNVPAFNFGWQFRYVLVAPKSLAKGTVLRCTAVYDNTTLNAFNPDPSATVRPGPLTTDEMFQAMFDVYQPVERGISLAVLPLVILSTTLAMLACRNCFGNCSSQRRTG